MRVASVSIGQIREMTWKGKTVETGIFKRPLDRRVRVGLLGIEGDEHANKAQHGGSMKALFAYPSEHYYEFWRDALRGISLSHGGFGENLTTEGWLEEQVYVADKYRVGTALVAVTLPRSRVSSSTRVTGVMMCCLSTYRFERFILEHEDESKEL
jgi:MOSC domain-containing protein YiiM